MSRRGKLSRGCATCRKRKIRCDETHPACRQCSKAGWICPQYGDMTGRLFQNQTVADFTGHPTPEESFAGNEATPAAVYLDSCALQQGMRSGKSVMPQHIIQPLAETAIDLFLASHVPRDTVFIRGCFEYLPDFRRDNSNHPGFSASLKAAALAAYGNTVQSSSILTQARAYLGVAIRCINTALMSPQEAVKDSTVISIMLLATFETITCKDQQSLKDCDMHTKGATTIIELRGLGQFQSRLGLQLFVQMCGDISRGCLQRSVRVPAGVIAARAHAATILGSSDLAWKLSDIVIRVANLRASVKERSLSTPSDIISTALEMDASLSDLAAFVPAEHKFEILQTQNNSDLVWEGFYHIYPSFWAAYFWNNLRTCRILLHQEIIRQVDSTSNVESENETQRAQSEEIIRLMGLDICATIPQYSGLLPLLASCPENSIGDKTTVSHPKLLPGSSVHAHAVYSLFWPLLIVGQATHSCHHRRWIVEQARHIGRTTGIHQAFTLADVLERQERIQVWED